MNVVTITGRIGNEITLNKTQNDKSVCNFNLAVKKQKDTIWIRIVAWGGTAELLNRFCKKGDMIGVTGSLDVREYEKDGSKRTVYEVIASQIDFLSSKKDDNGQEKLVEVESDDEFGEDLPF